MKHKIKQTIECEINIEFPLSFTDDHKSVFYHFENQTKGIVIYSASKTINEIYLEYALHYYKHELLCTKQEVQKAFNEVVESLKKMFNNENSN